MADNPLLPQARLRELYVLMQQCRSLDRKRRPAGLAREGLLAATAMQLEAGDWLSAEPGDATAATLAPATLNGNAAPAALPAQLRLPLCAGTAAGLRQAGSKGVVLAYARAGMPEPSWAGTLAWAQQEQLPLLLVCADAATPGRRKAGDTLTYEAATLLGQRCGLPVFPVDGEDSVAVYRVMYEAVLRARSGGGPSVIWGLLNTPRKLAGQRSAPPLARLASYLKARGIRRSA